MDDDDDWDDAMWSSIAAIEASHQQQQQHQHGAQVSAVGMTASAWACRSCTLLNAADRSSCLVCHTPRGQQYTSAPPPPPPSSQSGARKTVQVTLPFASREPAATTSHHSHNQHPFNQVAVVGVASSNRPKQPATSSTSTINRPPTAPAWHTRPAAPFSSGISAPAHPQQDEDGPQVSVPSTLAQIMRLRHRGEDAAAKNRYLLDDSNGDGGRAASPLPSIDAGAAQSFIYPTNYAVREYQLAITEKALYHNTLVSLPTGLGKTLIASVVMYNFYRWFPRGQIVFMAPTKPLVAQQIGACHEIMGIPVADTAELQGSVPPAVRETLWQTKRVFFCTPQSLQNDLQRGICDARRLVCLVVDEAHRATGNYAYCTVIQQIEATTRRFRVLALSATPGAKFDVIQDVIRNLRITHIESRSADDSDVKAHTYARQEEVIKCSLSSHISETKTLLMALFHRVLPRLAASHILPHTDPDRLTKFMVLQVREKFRTSPQYATHRSAESDLAVLVTLLHARDLLTGHGLRALSDYLEKMVAEAQDPQKKVSWAKKQLYQSTAFHTLRLSLTGVADSTTAKSDSHPKMLKLRDVLHEHFQRHAIGNSSTRAIVFTQFRSSVLEIVALLSSLAPLIKAQQFVGQGATGKDKQSKGQSQKEQQEIVRRFRAGHFNVLVATCIAEEGLDIGEVDLIVSFDALTSPVRMIQRMGRTGRKRVGRVVILVTEGDEEKKLARSVAAAKTVSRALTTFKNKFTYATCPRMLPRGVDPELVPLEMEIPEFHASQVAGKQQAATSSTRGDASEKRDLWRLHDLERSLVRGKYAPYPGWGDGPRHEITPLTVSRKVLLRRRRPGESAGVSSRARALRLLVRQVHGVEYDDEVVDAARDRRMQGTTPTPTPTPTPTAAERPVDEEMLAFSDVEDDGDLHMHFSPPFEPPAPPPPERSDSVSSKPESSPKRPSASPQRGSSTSSTKRTPSPGDHRSSSSGGGKRGKKKVDRPRDAIDENLLARGDALLKKLHALVMSDATTDDASSPEPEPRIPSQQSDSVEQPEVAWPRLCIARRLAFDGVSADASCYNERDNCVPMPPPMNGEPGRMTAKDRREPVLSALDLIGESTTRENRSADVAIVEGKTLRTTTPPRPPLQPSPPRLTHKTTAFTKPRRSLALRDLPEDPLPPTPSFQPPPLPTSSPAPVVKRSAHQTTSSPRTKPSPSNSSPLLPAPSPASTTQRSSRTSQDTPCSICSESESFDDDPIVFCDGCDVAVHQFCYGIPTLPSSEWFCDACQDPQFSTSTASTRRCALCPVRSASHVMKQTACGKWVHVQCFLWIPELQFHYNDGSLQLDALTRLDPDRRALSCALCRSSKGGGVIQCAHKRCLAAFHVSCAADAARQRYQLAQIDRDDVETLFVGYCPLHNDSTTVWRPPATPSPQQTAGKKKSSPEQQRRRLLSPSMLLASPSQDHQSKKQRKRLKRKYDASQRESTPSPWSKRVKRSARREHNRAMARMFIEDQVDAPSSDEYEEDDDDDEEMDDADREFINDSSQLIYSPTLPSPERKRKQRKRHSLGEMRAIYAQSLIESPQLRRGRSHLPTGGIIDAVLQEMAMEENGSESDEDEDGDGDEEAAAELEGDAIEIDDDGDDNGKTQVNAPSFSLLAAPTHPQPEPTRPATQARDQAIADEAALLQERIEANRRRALQLREAKKQAVPVHTTVQPAAAVAPPSFSLLGAPALSVVEEPTTNAQVSSMSASLSTTSFAVVARELPAGSPFASVLNACESAALRRLECTRVSSLEADLMLSVRTAAVAFTTDQVTSSSPSITQNVRVDLVRNVFKRFVVVVVAQDDATARTLSTSPAIVQLRAMATCRSVVVAADHSQIVQELIAIASDEAEQGFALPSRQDVVPSGTGVDPHFYTRFQFFASTQALSLGSIASLSFRFDKFRVAQIPVAKFNEMHWRRMLPWVSEETAKQLHAIFLAKS